MCAAASITTTHQTTTTSYHMYHHHYHPFLLSSTTNSAEWNHHVRKHIIQQATSILASTDTHQSNTRTSLSASAHLSFITDTVCTVHSCQPSAVNHTTALQSCTNTWRKNTCRHHNRAHAFRWQLRQVYICSANLNCARWSPGNNHADETLRVFPLPR